MRVENPAGKKADYAGHLDASDYEQLRREVGSQAYRKDQECLDDGSDCHESEMFEDQRRDYSVDQANQNRHNPQEQELAYDHKYRACFECLSLQVVDRIEQNN